MIAHSFVSAVYDRQSGLIERRYNSGRCMKDIVESNFVLSEFKLCASSRGFAHLVRCKSFRL